MVDYKKEPITNVIPAASKTMRRFIFCFAISVSLIAGALIIVSAYGNYFGFFGPAGQFEFYNGRAVKTEYLLGLDRSELPDAWIIGSSDTMPFQSRSIDRYFSVRSTFNLGSFWGRVEDMWAWTNFILTDLQSTPELVIFGVEPWSFADDQRGPPLLTQYRRRTIATPHLAKYLPNYSSSRYQLSRFLDSLSLQNTRLMLRMFRRYGFTRVRLTPLDFDPLLASPDAAESYIVPESPFALDGTNKPLSRTDIQPFLPDHVNAVYSDWVAASSPDDDILTLTPERRALVDKQYIRLDKVVNFLPGDRMDKEDMNLFRQTIALLHARNVEVGVIMLPVHPYYFDLLNLSTQHAEHLATLESFLLELQNDYPNFRTVLNASHIVRFHGSPLAFHDELHMTPVNTELVLNEFQRKWHAD